MADSESDVFQEGKNGINEETFCFSRPFENAEGHTHANYPVDAAINWFHEFTGDTWKHSQAINWSIRYKCWKLNFRKVTDWAARMMFLNTMNIKRERGLTSHEMAKYLTEEGLVPTFWEPHIKQKVPNIIGDLEYLLMTMKRLFPGKYNHLEQNDICELIGKHWRIKEISEQFMWQEYGESYKDCLRKLEKGGPGQSKSSLLNDTDSKKENKLYSGQYVVQLLISSSAPDQVYLMLRVTQCDYNLWKCEVLNVCHYPIDKGDGTEWLYRTKSIKMRYGRWNVIKDATPLTIEI